MDRLTPTKRPSKPVVMRQQWRHLTFLHWAVPPAMIQGLLPPGLTVDTFDGNAYIGLVPFTMRDVRPVWSPPIRGLSHFHETNVRTYVHANGEKPGVWFFSLDAANEVAVWIARSVWGLPYYFAQMSVIGDGDALMYTSRRLRAAPAASHVRTVPTGLQATALPDTLEFFLVERYILYSYTKGRLFRGQVHHAPYLLQTATVTDLRDDLIAAAGIGLPADRLRPEAPLAHYASSVDVEIFALEPVGKGF